MSDLAWHFLRDDRTMQYSPYSRVQAGETYLAVGPLALCSNGMHASLRALDALCYAPGSIVCRVRIGDERLVEHDKVCARARTVLWLADANTVLHEFSCLVAERALAGAAAAGQVLDPRLTAAVAAKRAWLRGEISDEALDGAREGAWDVVWSVVGEVAWDAAWAAARIASWSIARDAAWGACRAAMEAAGGDPTDPLNGQLEHMLLALAPAEWTLV